MPRSPVTEARLRVCGRRPAALTTGGSRLDSTRTQKVPLSGTLVPTAMSSASSLPATIRIRCASGVKSDRKATSVPTRSRAVSSSQLSHGSPASRSSARSDPGPTDSATHTPPGTASRLPTALIGELSVRPSVTRAAGHFQHARSVGLAERRGAREHLRPPAAQHPARLTRVPGPPVPRTGRAAGRTRRSEVTTLTLPARPRGAQPGRKAHGGAERGGRMHDLELTCGSATHPGLRAENQDRYLAAPPVFAIADGMGGHAEGAAASEAVVLRLAALAGGPTTAVEELKAALRQADEDILRIGSAAGGAGGAGTTVAGVALVEDCGSACWAVFHVGDSRIYRWTPAGLEQISTDHSVVQELIAGGHITEGQAQNHPQRHMITRAIGFGDRGEPEVALLPVTAGESFLICSDGLSGVIPEARLAELMSSAEDYPALAEQLVREAAEAGGSDNISVVVVHVGEPAR